MRKEQYRRAYGREGAGQPGGPVPRVGGEGMEGKSMKEPSCLETSR